MIIVLLTLLAVATAAESVNALGAALTKVRDATSRMYVPEGDPL